MEKGGEGGTCYRKRFLRLRWTRDLVGAEEIEMRFQ